MAAVDRSLWQGIIEQVVSSGGNIIRPWFTQLEPLSLDHGLLEIQVPGRKERDYCQRHAMRLFTEAAQASTGRLVGVCFLTAADAAAAQRMILAVAPSGRGWTVVGVLTDTPGLAAEVDGRRVPVERTGWSHLE